MPAKKKVTSLAKVTKKPVVITTKNQKTIASAPKEVRVDTSKLSKNKKFQELLDDAITGIEIDTDDLDDEMLEAWEEFDDELRPKLAKKNWALWAAIFSPVILPGIVKGMRSEPTVPQPKVIIKGRQQEVVPPVEPRKIVNYCQEYFKNHGLSLCKSLTETDLSRLKDDLKQNWDKGPDAFAEAFKESYPISKSRLETIYKNERHQAEYSGVLERAKNADHSYKRWETIGDERTCDVCLAMDGEIVSINEKFSNGQMIPSAHVNCRCSMTTYSEEDYDDLPDEYIRQDASYLNEVAEQLKLNYKCEFNGTDYKCGNTIPSDDSKEIKIDNPFELNQKLSKYININEVQKAYDDAASELFEKYGSGPDSDWPPELIKEYEDAYDKINHLNKIHIDAVREFNYNAPQINNPTKDREKLLASQLKDTLDTVSTKQDLVMWRGEHKSDWEELAKTGSGSTDRFTSITQSKSIAEQFKGGSEPYLIRIEMPAGTHAIPSWNQGVESPNEKEWILNKDTKLEVIGKSGNILNVRVVNNKTKQDSAYLHDVANFIKLNYKCEFNGIDNKCNIDNTSEKDTKSRSRTGTKKSKSVSKPSIDKRTNKDDLHQILLTSKAQSTKFSKAQQSEVDEFFDKYKEYKTMFDYHLKMGVVSMKEKQQINALRNELNDISKKLSKELKFKVSRFDYTKEVAKYIDHVETIEYGISDPGETPKLGPLDPRRIIEVSHTEKGYAPVLESSKKFLSDNKDFKVTLRDYVSESPFSGIESGYKGVNLLLAGKEPKDPNKAAILLSKLDTLFKEAPPIPIDIMVWRGGSDSDKKRMLSAGNGDLNNLVGSVKECKPFVSCTMSERIADAFASKPFLDYQSNGLIYEITIPKGAKAISTQGTNYEIDEAEILINRGANLLITGVEDMGKKTKIKCSLVSSGGK